MHPNGSRMALAMLLLLCSCSNAPDAAESREQTAGATAQPSPAAASSAPVSGPDNAEVCEPDAPESPCPIIGRWRIARVYNPGLADPLTDDREMVGATLTITGNGDGPGVLRWDGPGNGQYDASDECIGPYLSARGAPAGDPAATRALAAALSAWSIAADPAGARALGCDQGQWTAPTDPAGERYGIVLPLGDRAAIQWYEGRFLLLDRVG